MSCSTCTDDCRQGRDCPNRKVISMDKIKCWAVAFIVGATVGMIVQQAILINSMKKDCEILGLFRIGETPYFCKPSVK